MQISLLRLLLFVGILAMGCSGGEDDITGVPDDSFDREAMLRTWADEIILPSYADFLVSSGALLHAAEQFEATPSPGGFADLRAAFVTAYRAWQGIDLYQLGRAEVIGLREQVNVYPAEVAAIEVNLSSGTYNLELPSERDRQGFPALDYLLYGSAANEQAIYERAANEPGLRAYLVAVSGRIDGLVRNVQQAWIDGYRDEFVGNSGNGATSSVDRFVNDYIFYYEKWLRAGKVGIPAGVFSGNPLATHVEARYNRQLGKTLALDALATVQDFFNGIGADGQETAYGFADYLNFLNAVREGDDLARLINDQFAAARRALEALDQDLANQVNTDNTAMLSAYDELQRNVVLLKVDMLQAFNVSVDFVDADGD